MAESKEVEVNGVTKVVWGVDDDGVKDAQATAKADSELVDLDIDDPAHANLTFDELQNGDTAVAAADPDPRDDTAAKE
jgi:hypothetical protein